MKGLIFMKKVISAFLTIVIAAVLAVPAAAASKPDAPAKISAKVKSSTSVSVSWEAVKGAEKYIVYYSTAKKEGYKQYGSTTKTSATVKKLTEGTKYWFRVKAVKDGVKSAYSSPVSATPEKLESDSADIKITSKPGKVANNDYASLTIQGKPNTEYTLKVYYTSKVSSAKGTGKMKSDAKGVCKWTWKVGASTKAGKHRIDIMCDGKSYRFDDIFETVKK